MFRLAALVLVPLALLGCTDRDASPTPTATVPISTSTPTVTATTTPTPAARPGIPPGANTIIDAVLARDTATLERLVQLTSLLCGPQQGPGSPPPCPVGQSGASVDVFPVVTCEGELRPASTVRPTLDESMKATRSLTGVYRAPEMSLPGARADYIAVFSREAPGQPNLGVGVLIRGDRISGLWFGCGASPSEIVPPGTPPVFLPGG